MNFLRKLLLFTLYPKLDKKEITDFAILIMVCFMIVFYKVIKS
jgi:hypothetical protein